MQNAGLEESQAGIKIARININNLRYKDYTTTMLMSCQLDSGLPSMGSHRVGHN